MPVSERSTAVGAAADADAGAPLDEVVAERFSAAFERIAIGDKRLLMLLIKNPAGANEADARPVDGAAPRVGVVVALNDAIADGRDVSWIWDVDFEPLSAGSTVVASGSRAAAFASPTGHRGTCPRSKRRSTVGSNSPRPRES